MQGSFHAASMIKVDAEHPAPLPHPALSRRRNIGEMARKVSATCAFAGCHYQRNMTLAEREELRRVGHRGKREYVQVLRVLETFSQEEVYAAIREPSVWEPSASTPSSTWCCAGWRDVRQG